MVCQNGKQGQKQWAGKGTEEAGGPFDDKKREREQRATQCQEKRKKRRNQQAAWNG
jgi:hypothetical protein